MKLDVADITALAAVAPSSVTAYLRGRGWQSLRVEHELGFFQLELDGEVVELDVPLRKQRDYARRLYEVIENLALLEHRSEYEVYQNLVRANQDVVKISIDVPETGRIGLDEASVLFAAAHDLVLSAACSTHSRRAYFPSRKPQRALEYIKRVNLAAPEAGSFVVVLESPLPQPFPQQPQRALKDTMIDDAPFERAVLLTLANAARAIQKAIEISTASGSVESFSNDVEIGVNANYCDALATMLQEGPGRDVTFGFAWSPSRPVDQATPCRLRFSKNEAPVLRAAATFLKERAPLSDFELVGQIVKLEALSPAQGGTVTVAGLIDNAIRQVQFLVGAEDYRRALEAHQHERIVSVEGDLVKDGRSFRLSNTRLFSVLS